MFGRWGKMGKEWRWGFVEFWFFRLGKLLKFGRSLMLLRPLIGSTAFTLSRSMAFTPLPLGAQA